MLRGGGFIAGLIVAIAYLMQYMASGFEWANIRQRAPYHALIGAGVLVVASATGVASWLAERPFLTSTFGYVKLPFIDEFEIASASAFDLGVFLCVLGAVMLALESLARLAHRRGERPSAHAMDVDPRADPRRERAEMEALYSSAIGVLTAAGLYLVLRRQTFPVILGLAFLSYAVNLFLFASGRLVRNLPPLLNEVPVQTDPLPQALVLTAIVISFA